MRALCWPILWYFGTIYIEDMGKVELWKILDLDPDFVMQKTFKQWKKLHQLLGISMKSYSRWSHLSMDNGLCRRRMLPRFWDSIRTTQHSADAEVIASQKQKDTSSQKQKDTLNTFKSFLQEQRDKQKNIYLKRRCLKTTNNSKYFFSFLIMNVVTKKVTHLHVW